jgi:uncharacterized HAD superfamily protein
MTYHSKNRICVDLCNTVAHVSKLIERVFGPIPNPLLYSHPRTPKIFWEKENKIARKIFESAEPIEGAAETLNQLAQKYEIVYLTARPEWAKELSVNWLSKHGFPKAEIVCTQDKYSWIKENGALMMFEDDPKHIKEIQTLIQVLVHAQPWNQGFETRFNNWRDIIDRPKHFNRKRAIKGVEESVRSKSY